jgi:ABC-type cobalamin transport system ATPase subunit
MTIESHPQRNAIQSVLEAFCKAAVIVTVTATPLGRSRYSADFAWLVRVGSAHSLTNEKLPSILPIAKL